MPLLAIGLLLLNDHVMKEAFHNAFTGKLSDFAGLAFFPLVLQGLWEAGQSLLRRPWQPSRRVLLVSGLLTALYFSGVQLWEPVTESYRWALGVLQWPAHALAAGAVVPVVPVAVWPDPWDLVALPAIGLAIWSGWERARPRG